MKKLLLLLGTLAITFVSTARAGDIIGTVRGKTGAVVVWVEGVKRFQIPNTRPSISQRGQRFSPPLLVIVAGQTVDIPNDDEVAHNVFSLSPGNEFNLAMYPTGKSKSVLFKRPGVVEISCLEHHHMNAKIIVVPTPYYARIDAGEEYRIAGLPPGKYVVRVWSQNIGTQSKAITVPETGDARADF